MRRLFRKKLLDTLGHPPGTMIHVGNGNKFPSRVSVINYDQNKFERSEVDNPSQCLAAIDKNNVTWINLEGVHDIAMVEALGKEFGLHPLVMEAIVNTETRPHLESYGDYLFLVLRRAAWDHTSGGISFRQLCVILGHNYVITFYEQSSDILASLANRLQQGRGTIRSHGADYLAYAILDQVIDRYYYVMEHLGERLETLEDQVLANPESVRSGQLHQLKTELLYLRKSVIPMREVANQLRHDPETLFAPNTHPFLRDLYDHTLLVIETLDVYRDMVSSLFDMYLSSISNRMNAVMKVLTLVATIFIPLTFIAGWYGMNFKHMPELELRWAYPALGGLMLLVAVGMIIYFKKKKWM